MGDITVNSLTDAFCQLLTQRLALLIYIAVTSSAEVDALEGTSFLHTGLKYLSEAHFSVATHGESLSRSQLLYLIGLQVEGSLYHRTLTGQHYNFLIAVPESRSQSPRITHAEHLTASGEAAYHITTVKERRTRVQNIAHVDILLYEVGDVQAFKLSVQSDVIHALALSVQSVSHQFQHHISVAVDAGVMTFGHYLIEHIIGVGEVEVAAQTQVLGLPVVSAHEGMHIRKATLAGRRIPEVAHIYITSKWQILLHKGYIRQLLG